MINNYLNCRRLINILIEKFPKNKTLVKKSFLSNPYFSHSFVSGKRYYGKTYEGEGKTVAVVISKRISNTVTISSVKTYGFVLSSEAELVGAMILFPNAVFHWSVSCAEEVNEESLTLFKLIEPKLDILVFGYGLPQDYTPKVRQNFTQICKKLGIRFEALPTEQAAGLFNFFSFEERFAAAALIPPKSINPFRYRPKQQQYKDIGFEEDEEDEENKSSLPEDYENRKLLT